MRGFPKHLNSKTDFQNCMNDYPEETKAELQRLLDNRYVWRDKAIIEESEGIEDDTHRVISSEEDGTEIEYVQQELVEDENAELFRLGFTVEEAEELIK